jgi:MarR family transcriptional regulator, organic hydroperoxide resistance regulator
MMPRIMTVSARKRALSARSGPADEPEGFPLTISRPELTVNGSDREFRHLVHSLFGFLARHEQIRSGHAKVIGLAGIEYTVLISVAHLSVEGAVNVKTVADHLHVSGAFVTSVVSRLQNLGVIHKKTDTDDRRRVTLTVSAKGHAALARLAPVQRQVNDVEFDGLTREEFRFMLQIVDRLIASGDRAVALQNYLLSGLGAATNGSARRKG